MIFDFVVVLPLIFDRVNMFSGFQFPRLRNFYSSFERLNEQTVQFPNDTSVLSAFQQTKCTSEFDFH